MTVVEVDREAVRGRLLEQVEEEQDEGVLLAAELAMVALREPLEPGPVGVLLRHLADQLEAALERQEGELQRLRRMVREQGEELGRLRGR